VGIAAVTSKPSNGAVKLTWHPRDCALPGSPFRRFNAEKQEIGRWANNRVENNHLSFRRRERAMLRFRRIKTLQKFASVHANIHNHFNLKRHLIDRQTYKERRSAALAEWQMPAS
jgi:putative transposase